MSVSNKLMPSITIYNIIFLNILWLWQHRVQYPQAEWQDHVARFHGQALMAPLQIINRFKISQIFTVKCITYLSYLHQRLDNKTWLTFVTESRSRTYFNLMNLSYFIKLMTIIILQTNNSETFYTSMVELYNYC